LINKGLGQYDQEYNDCSCFWGHNPGKFVVQLTKYLKGGHVLDLGAGEGKNSIYLSRLGFKITAVECSNYAISNFKRTLSGLEAEVQSRIDIVKADAMTYKPEFEFDGVICYGLLHCLPNKKSAFRLVENVKKFTKQNGFNIIVTFTDSLPIPSVQDYLQPCFVPVDRLLRLYADWNVILKEEEIITETHPTSKIQHEHSLVRLITQRI
jgi:tellurite methyltransferase